MEFYISEIARRDHKITLLEDTIGRLKAALQEKEQALALLERQAEPRQRRGSIERPCSLKDKEDTIIGLMAQINREKDLSAGLRQQLAQSQE